MYKKFPLPRRLVCFVFITSILLSYAVSVPTSEANNNMTWGVTYSLSQAEYLGLDPKVVYQSIIQDLGAKHIKLHVNWNSIEQKKLLRF
jgi:hypothetical protein